VLTTRSSKSRTRGNLQPFTPEAGSSPFPGYKLLRLRGRGGFATVWEASDPNGLHIALKFMSSRDELSTVREVRALRTFTRLNHKHLLPIHEVWSIPGQIVIGMDLADASLLDMMYVFAEEFGTSIEPVRLMKHLNEAALALDFLNARKHMWEGRTVGFQHGDIKPNNILIVGDIAKLADYGLATPTAGPKTPCHRHGTVEYVAPEIFQGYATDNCDQFSLAVTYHVLRTGHFPYPPPPPAEAIGRNFTRPAPDLSAVSAAERPALHRALSPIPANRFASCVELIHTLSVALGIKSSSHAMRVN
jgi:serine/threonine protein kinase, bacterial